MSLIGDIAGLFSQHGSSPTALAEPPVPFSSTSRMVRLFGKGYDPEKRNLDLTTAESTLFSVLDLISADIGSTDWSWYRKRARVREGEDRAPVKPTESLAVKLWEKPNPFMTGVQLRTVNEWHYDAVGEGWQVIQYNAFGIPESFWPVRPDRLHPVTDPEKFRTGWIYTGPNGEQVPLGEEDLIRVLRPHPIDPHRGIGAVQTLNSTLTTSLTAQQWIQAFYSNDATPGGMIEVGGDKVLEWEDYKKLVDRWNQQHRGVNRAHRVGLLEIGSYKQFSVNLKDLQFAESRQLTRDTVLEAFRIHKHMLGISEDVNRAASVSADVTYGKRTLNPRLKMWRDFANNDYATKFGVPGTLVEAEFPNPVPEDVEEENQRRESKAKAAKDLREAGWHPDDILMTVGLPAMRFSGTADNSSVGSDPEGGAQ